MLAFKVVDDDRTAFYDQTWSHWSGTSFLAQTLSKEYSIRKIVCFKGVNVVPDVFKYLVLIEFLMDEDQNDIFARDCMQNFRIRRMSGYAALYKDMHSKDIENQIDHVQNSALAGNETDV